MKRLGFIIAVLATTIALTWLVLHRPKFGGDNILIQPPAPPATNAPLVEAVPVTPSVVAKANPFVRPPDVDEGQWNRVMLIRQTLLDRNQPVEFYARVIDQSEQPVPRATLKLRLARVDEALFATTNFFHMQLGKEMTSENFELISDAQGWLELKSVTGFSVSIWGLAKEGYTSNLPQGNYGGVSYESNGRRNPSGHILMTNAWNPTKGYTFHLWKKGETERLVRWQSGFGLLRPTTNVLINLVSGRVVATAGDADLEAQVEYLFPDDPDKAADRRIHLRGLHGLTLVETDHPYPYLAAETGYAPAVHYDTLPSQGYGPGGTWNWQKNFYILARGGRIRGAIRLDFNSGEMNFGISGYVNPTGTRNLEPDPEKQITDAEEIRRLDETTRQ